MMNRKLSFGEFEGRSFEWLFFNAPWYADWMHRNNVLEGRWDYDEDDRACFRELHRRASALAGECPYCNQRRIVRRALATYRGGLGRTTLGASAFCCKECDPIDERSIIYEKPSFFMRPRQWARVDQKNLTFTIKAGYIGRGNLTQKRMEDFFKNDELFWYATPNFFTESEVQQ